MFTKMLVAAGLAAVAAAQSATLGFTRVPNPITAGKAETITYKTSDESSPVTIVLRKGQQKDLQTISTLTSSAIGGQYVWTPSESLVSGSDYALEITQGSETNYYGPFTLNGGSSSSAVSSSMSASGYPSSMSSTVITASRNATMTGTGYGSMGTGMSMSRNTTMSRPTLTRTASLSSATSTESGAGFQGSQTGTAAPSSTGAANMITTGGSVVALVLGAVAAAVFA